MSVIQRAKNLVEQKGKDEAIKEFQADIDRIGKPRSFDEVCSISAYEVAIEWINGEHRPEPKE